MALFTRVCVLKQTLRPNKRYFGIWQSVTGSPLRVRLSPLHVSFSRCWSAPCCQASVWGPGHHGAFQAVGHLSPWHRQRPRRAALQAQSVFAVAASYFLGDLICVVEESVK